MASVSLERNQKSAEISQSVWNVNFFYQNHVENPQNPKIVLLLDFSKLCVFFQTSKSLKSKRIKFMPGDDFGGDGKAGLTYKII